MTNIMRRVGLILGGLLVFAFGFAVQADAPYNLTVSTTTAVSISLSWTNPLSQSGFSRLERRPVNGNWTELAYLESDTSYVDSQVLCNQTYEYRIGVVADYIIGLEHNDSSEIISATTLPCISLNVTTSAGGNDGTCDATHCSLGEAIAQAHTASSTEATAIYLPAGTYNLGNFEIETNVLLIGADAETTILEDTDLSLRSGSNHVLLQNLTIRGGEISYRAFSAPAPQIFVVDSVIFETEEFSSFEVVASGALFELRNSLIKNRSQFSVLRLANSDTIAVIEGNSIFDNTGNSIFDISGSAKRVFIRNNSFSNNLTASGTASLFDVSSSDIQFLVENNTFAYTEGYIFSIGGAFSTSFIRYRSNILLDNTECFSTRDEIEYSLGGNVILAPICGLSAQDDITSSNTDTIEPLMEVSNGTISRWIHPLSEESVARDVAACYIVDDQLGRQRPANGICDAGALEGGAEGYWPSNLQANFDGSQVLVTWQDNFDDEDAFSLERSSDGGTNWTEIAEVGADNTNYSDTNLSCGTWYDYRIRAYYEGTDSYSQYGNTATTEVICQLAAPTNLQQSYPAQSFNFESIMWEDNSSDETAFLLERSDDGGASWAQVAQVEANTIFHSDEGLACGTNFKYRVRAANLASNLYSLYSNVLNTSTQACVPPPASAVCTIERFPIDEPVAPLHLEISGDGSRIAMATGTMADLQVYDSESAELLVTIPNTMPAFDLSDNGQQIAFESNADYTGQNADSSLEIFFWDNGTISQITDTSFYNWDYIPAISGDGSTIVFAYGGDVFNDIELPGQYYLYIWTEEDGLAYLLPESTQDFANVNISDDANLVVFWHDGNLTGEDPTNAGMLYRKDLTTGTISSIEMPDANISMVRMNEDGSRLVAYGTGVTAENPDGNAELFVWDAANGWQQLSNTAADIDSENWLFASMDKTGTRILFVADFDLTGENPAGEFGLGEYFLYDESLGFSQLTNHNTPDFYLQDGALSEDGERAVLLLNTSSHDPSEYAYRRVFTADCPPVFVAPNTLAADYADSAVSLRWQDNADDETSYLLERSSNGGTTWTEIAELPANSSSYEDESLTCGANYQYRLRGYRDEDALYSSYSNTASVSISCTVLAPILATEPDYGPSTDMIEFYWTDLSNNETAFLVERSDDDGASWIEIAQLPANENGYFDDLLACNTGYQYRVRAYKANTGDYSPYSNILSLATQDCFAIPESSICTLQRLDTEVPSAPFFSFLSGDGSRVALLDNNETDEWTDPNYDYIRHQARLFDTETGELLATIPYLLTMDISNDGTKIVFLSGDDYTGQNADESPEFFLWNNGVYTQLTNSTIQFTETDIFPHISGNGSTILFTSPIKYSNQTYIDDQAYIYIWRQSTGLQLLVNQATEDYSGLSTAISDNGNTVIFSHEGNLTGADPNHEGLLYRKNLGTGNLSSVGDRDIWNLHINADGSRIVGLSAQISNENPDGNNEIMLWDAQNGWRQITHTTGVMHNFSFPWMDATGQRLIFNSGLDITGENPANDLPYDNEEFFIYDDGLGFSQISNHDTPLGFPIGNLISNDGTKAALILNTYNGEDNALYMYQRIFIADCPPPPLPSETVLAPYNLRVTNQTSTSLTLAWNDASNNESGFEIEVSEDGISWELAFSTAENGTSFGDADLVCGATYDYRVRAYSESLDVYSPYSNVLSVTLASCALPRPTHLTVTATSIEGISLSWTDNSTETGFVLERSTSGLNWTSIPLAANTTSYSDTGLECNSSYFYRLRAFDSGTNTYSVYTPIVGGTTSACPPLATSTLSISNTEDFGLELSWTAVPYADSYEVYEVGAGGALTLLETLPNSSLQTAINGLACYANKTYTLLARRSDDNTTSRSNDVNFVVTVCPDAPTNLVASTTYNSLALSWTDNADNETAYLLERYNGSSWQLVINLPADSTSYTHAALECQTSYQYRLRAYNELVEQYSSAAGLTSSTSTCPPLVPSVLSSTGSTASSISLDWTVDDTATTFTLWVSNGSSWASLGSFNETNHVYTHSALSCATTYQYRIQTHRVPDNATSYSAVFSASSAACAPLTAPSAPVVLNEDTALVSLQIPSKPAGASSMRLERSADGATWQTLGSASGSYIDTSVACATSYQYRLLAVRGGDESPASPVANATTDACPSVNLARIGLYQNGRWRFNDTSNGITEINFGSGAGWQALTGDWDGDGEDGLALYKDGLFILRSTITGTGESRLNFGLGTGWQAVAGDWNGDGTDSFGLYKDGLFILSNDNSNEAYRFNFGSGTGWQAIAGDWDGNGADTIGLYKNGIWHLTDSLVNPVVTRNFSFGPEAPNWLALAGDWDGDGTDGVGIYGVGSWRLRETASGTGSEEIILFGSTSGGWFPFASNPVDPTTPPEEIPVLADDDDSDGLSNGDENLVHGTDPDDSDSDDDGLSDGEEIIIEETDPLDADSDDDGLNDGDEVNSYGSNPNDSDSDGDGLEDAAEVNTHNTDPDDSDSDDDGLSDAEEIDTHNTNPNDNDSDDDGLLDGAEVNLHDSNPLSADSDGDGLSDSAEVNIYGSDPNNSDSDNDGLGDAAEVNTHNTDPDDSDSDNDLLNDGDEINTHNTNPNDNDSDDDGLRDGMEVNTFASNPLDPNSDDDDMDDLEEAQLCRDLNDPIDTGVTESQCPVSDTDADGLSDSQEVYGFSMSTHLVCDINDNCAPINGGGLIVTDPSDEDTDDDGLSDGEEALGVSGYFSDPTLVDTDNDGIDDGEEAEGRASPQAYITNPSDADTDGDGIGDYEETFGYILTNLVVNGVASSTIATTNPTDTDSDDDGLSDGDEYFGNLTYNLLQVYLNPDSVDTDSDGLEDGDELTGVLNTLFGNSATNPTHSDTDSDLLKDGEEIYTYFVNPLDENTDGDSCTFNGQTQYLDDYFEAKGFYVNGQLNADALSDGYNGNDLDADGDSLNDCDEVYYYNTNPYAADSDGDGMTDTEELTYFCRNPLIPDSEQGTCSGGSSDSDGDGLPDSWEMTEFGDLSQTNTDDPDSDNCNNLCEYQRRTEPLDSDTDNDGLLDGAEVGTNPADSDSDDDGLTDGQEVNGVVFNTSINGSPFTYSGGAKPNPLRPDTDNDGLSDYIEVVVSYTRFDVADTDSDGLSDSQEYMGIAFSSIINGTPINTTVTSNPLNSDGDGDGLSDYKEIYIYGTFPNNIDTDGDTIRDGTTNSIKGEEDNDFNASLLGWGSNPRDVDTDSDGLSDGIELWGISGYAMTVDGLAVVVELPGHASTSSPRLGLFNTDSDNDGLSDGDEVNVHHTNPLDPDSDDDALLDWEDPDPLNP